MLTFLQIKNILVAWFNNHAQINSVYYLNDDDFNAERNIDYATANINYQSSTISDKTINHLYSISITDRTEPDNTDMETEVISDALHIAEDLFTYLQNYGGIIFSKSTNIKPISDDTADRTTGIQFTVTLSTIRPQNRCNTPTK